MRIVNQSRLPTAEVEALVRLGFRGVRDAGVVVKVKNRRRGPYSGRTYPSVPACSPEAARARTTQLVTVAIGPDAAFPDDNLVTETRTVRKIEVHGVDPGRGDSPYRAAREVEPEPVEPEHFGGASFAGNRCCAVVHVVVTERHPYGGKRSPVIVVADWREALVTVAAHEARHVWQFQRRRAGKHQPLSEVDAERHAASVLAAYRESGEGDGGVAS